ncbi:MAG: CRISPR-associated protein Csx3, partial [Roseiflexaceae bacterium]|nr:CRISPR-associated protein Csx3 [Roseiflexaceae bacterium]
GRGPNWLYAALALHAAPHPVYLFDPRLGWIAPVTLTCTPSATPSAISWKIETHSEYTRLEVQPGTPYLDYDEVNGAELPKLDLQRGIVLSGKIPLWLTVGACLTYRCHPWLAVVQAQQYDLGIIVTSKVKAYHPGSVVALRGNQ